MIGREGFEEGNVKGIVRRSWIGKGLYMLRDLYVVVKVGRVVWV